VELGGAETIAAAPPSQIEMLRRNSSNSGGNGETIRDSSTGVGGGGC
jgi:hypothetical protein